MSGSKNAVLHRMVMDRHVCPHGLKSKYLLESRVCRTGDHWMACGSPI